GRRTIAWDARHVVLGIVGAVVVVQAIYYAMYFATSPQLAVRMGFAPALWLPAMMLAMLVALHRDGWLIVRLPFLVIGGLIAAIVNVPVRPRADGQSRWRHLCDDVLRPWQRYSPETYLVRGGVFAAVPAAAVICALLVMFQNDPAHFVAPAVAFGAVVTAIWSGVGRLMPGRWPLPNWNDASSIADQMLAMDPITTMRQLYLLGCYSLLGISVLAKGPPGLAVVGAVGVFHIVLLHRWRALYGGAFELKRGLLLMIATFVPWHIAMCLKDGLRFIDEYVFTHVLNRAAIGVDNSVGTFEYYSSQIGQGMWLWA